ncbi:phosphoribosyltransferase family protein [Gilliamella intestini]|uniref:ComF family protein n=1 Tax=Gilliamella intestini TaxID=1798183 RepID=A0A1C4B792_9GAMM|nr:phosphoribosyltransferase family protein [Gilliamella intestini]SCC02727.1 comF family protein [Gilliamella intestini]
MRCILCDMPLFLPHHGICCQCVNNLPKFNKICHQCCLPHSLPTDICYRCRVNKPYWDELIAVSDYVNPLKKLIHHLKFYNKVELSTALARLMFLAWYQRRESDTLAKPDLVTCVPLHHIRYWSRGFNQAELLAKPIARWLNRDFYPYLLFRNKSGQDQKRLSLTERIGNVDALFICHQDLSNKSIMLIDDIVTTGNTINVISQQLKKCGATSVQVVCLCRTVL